MLVVAGFALLAVAATWPLALHPGSRVYEIATNFDAQFSVWNVAWVARTLVADPLHVFDANIFFPHRWALAYSEANLAAGALAAPVYWLTKNPYAAHNFVVLLSFVLSGCGAYFLARYVSLDRRAAAVAGVSFACCPHIFGHLPHIQLLMDAGLPFSLLALHRLADGPGAGRAVTLGLAMAAQAYLCAYYAVFVMLLAGYGVLFFAASRRLWRDRAYWNAVAAAAAVAVALTAPLAAVYAFVQRDTGFARSVEDAASFSANWSAYLASSAHAHAWMLAYLPRWNEVLFPGFVASVFAVLGIIAGFAARDRRRELALFYLSIAVLACWESFGPSAGLYRATYALPGFSFLRAPSRFGIIVMLGLAMLASLGVAALLARAPKPSLLGAALVAVASIELLTPLTFQPVPAVAPVYARLADLPTGAVLELPIYSEQFAFTRTRYMLASTAHWMPLVDAYSDYIPKDFIEKTDTLANFPDRASIEELRRMHVPYAVIHFADYQGGIRATLDESLDRFSADLKKIYADETAGLYEVTGAR